MKIDLAVYTAQEGYSWQPGTVFSAEDLTEFKKRIGKFPSPDASDFPFGGVFLLDGRVVFYRYHVAKKIDFRGRDALYCVLGAVSRAEASKIDPAALFASPEFAGPMKPFPTVLELPEADPSAVPEWLKNLDRNTLDVRITGFAENPSYAVVQEPVVVPKPPIDTKGTTPAGDPSAVTPAGGADGAVAPTGKDGVPEPTGGSGDVAAPEQQPSSAPVPVKKLSPWMVAGVAVLALLIIVLSVGAVWYCWKQHVDSQESPTLVNSPGQEAPGANAKPAEANAPQPAVDAPVSPAKVPEAVTKEPAASTNVSAATAKQPVAVATNGAPAATAPKSSSASSVKPRKPSAPQSSKVKSKANPAVAQKKASGKDVEKKGKNK